MTQQTLYRNDCPRCASRAERRFFRTKLPSTLYRWQRVDDMVFLCDEAQVSALAAARLPAFHMNLDSPLATCSNCAGRVIYIDRNTCEWRIRWPLNNRSSICRIKHGSVAGAK